MSRGRAEVALQPDPLWVRSLTFDHLELIDSLTEGLLDREDGELIATHLSRERCPVVRFKTRDRIRVSGATRSRGQDGTRFTCVDGNDDLLIVQGMNAWPSAVSDVLRALRPRVTGHLRIVSDGPSPVKIGVERRRSQRSERETRSTGIRR